MQQLYKTTGNLFSTIICTNCSVSGHTSKHCAQPITSYGVILFRCRDGWNQAAALQAGKGLTGFEGVEDTIEYLLIQRKDSIGFIEIVRGKYKSTDYDYIRKTLTGITLAERDKLLSMSFDELWDSVWGPAKDGYQAYKHEKEQGRQKLEALRAAVPSLETLLQEAAPIHTTPEWGFPKGRRNLNESEYACAMRETWEETNIGEGGLTPIRGLEPIAESFVGSNGISYCHRYFIAHASHGVGEEGVKAAAATNEHIQREVGDMKWFSLQDAIQHIRPDNPEKRDVLLRVHACLKLYCPLKLRDRSAADQLP